MAIIEEPGQSPVSTAPEQDLRWQKTLRRRFDRAAAVYGERAQVQHKSADDLLQRLSRHLHDGDHIADIGCGSGYLVRQLASRALAAAPSAQLTQQIARGSAQAVADVVPAVLALDISEGMLRAPDWRWLDIDHVETPRGVQRICADAACLPLASASIDVLVSNFALHWCLSPSDLLSELRRVMRLHGRAELVIPVLGSLQGRSERAATGSSLQPAQLWRQACTSGWRVEADQIAHYAEYYDTPVQWLDAIRALGVTARRGTGQGIAGRQAMQALHENLEASRTADGIPLAYEVLCLSLTAVEN